MKGGNFKENKFIRSTTFLILALLGIISVVLVVLGMVHFNRPVITPVITPVKLITEHRPLTEEEEREKEIKRQELEELIASA